MIFQMSTRPPGFPHIEDQSDRDWQILAEHIKITVQRDKHVHYPPDCQLRSPGTKLKSNYQSCLMMKGGNFATLIWVSRMWASLQACPLLRAWSKNDRINGGNSDPCPPGSYAYLLQGVVNADEEDNCW